MKKLAYISLALLLCACSEDSTLDIAGMFSPNGPTVEMRFKQSKDYNDLREELHMDMQSDDYTIYMCSDSEKKYGLLRSLRSFGSLETIVKEIDRVLDRYGKLADHASPELARTRT